MKNHKTMDTLSLRDQFPSLKRIHKNMPMIYLDGPGGTQVPESVISAVSKYYRRSNANFHGAFITSKETDTVIDTMRQNIAVFLGAEGPETISIGQNMTSLTYSLARAMARVFQPGDEVLITQLDHEANRGPWLTLRDSGINVKEIRLLPNGTMDYEDFEAKINENTRLVAMGLASNLIGTVNDIQRARKLTYEHNAWLLLDAVHYAPHFTIDVRQFGCDFLLCSAYKFYGPHVGLLYSRPGMLNQLPVDRLRTTKQMAPYSIETGTLNHAAIAGVSAAVDFIAALGKGNTLREKLLHAYKNIGRHESQLAHKLYNGVSKIPGVNIIGQDLTSPYRTPTISFTFEGKTPREVCTHLAKSNICAWDGHFYAIRAIEVLGLLEKGGVTRLGIAMYNTPEEMDITIENIEKLGKSH